MLCVCVRGKRRGEKHKMDKRQNEVLKKKEMYINKEIHIINENVALQGVTTNLVWSMRRVFYIESPSLFINLQQQLSLLGNVKTHSHGECEDS